MGKILYRITHVFLGIAVNLFLCKYPSYFIICGLFGALGAYIPDIKHAPYRRGKISHSLIIPVITIILTYLTIGFINGLDNYRFVLNIVKHILYSLSIGWITHVLSDSLTAQGVYILYPFTNYRLSVFKKLKSNSIIGNLFIMFISTLLIYFWLVQTSYGKILENLFEKIK
uniref:Metal-dependent hydrolase n=1 Tax=Staphylothermus marinus TaxID=2280 RepID=A0A7C4HA31_STAMA